MGCLPVDGVLARHDWYPAGSSCSVAPLLSEVVLGLWGVRRDCESDRTGAANKWPRRHARYKCRVAGRAKVYVVVACWNRYSRGNCCLIVVISSQPTFTVVGSFPVSLTKIDVSYGVSCVPFTAVLGRLRIFSVALHFWVHVI